MAVRVEIAHGWFIWEAQNEKVCPAGNASRAVCRLLHNVVRFVMEGVQPAPIKA